MSSPYPSVQRHFVIPDSTSNDVATALRNGDLWESSPNSKKTRPGTVTTSHPTDDSVIDDDFRTSKRILYRSAATGKKGSSKGVANSMFTSSGGAAVSDGRYKSSQEDYEYQSPERRTTAKKGPADQDDDDADPWLFVGPADLEFGEVKDAPDPTVFKAMMAQRAISKNKIVTSGGVSGGPTATDEKAKKAGQLSTINQSTPQIIEGPSAVEMINTAACALCGVIYAKSALRFRTTVKHVHDQRQEWSARFKKLEAAALAEAAKQRLKAQRYNERNTIRSPNDSNMEASITSNGFLANDVASPRYANPTEKSSTAQVLIATNANNSNIIAAVPNIASRSGTGIWGSNEMPSSSAQISTHSKLASAHMYSDACVCVFCAQYFDQFESGGGSNAIGAVNAKLISETKHLSRNVAQRVAATRAKDKIDAANFERRKKIFEETGHFPSTSSDEGEEDYEDDHREERRLLEDGEEDGSSREASPSRSGIRSPFTSTANLKEVAVKSPSANTASPSPTSSSHARPIPTSLVAVAIPEVAEMMVVSNDAQTALNAILHQMVLVSRHPPDLESEKEDSDVEAYQDAEWEAAEAASSHKTPSAKNTPLQVSDTNFSPASFSSPNRTIAAPTSIVTVSASTSPGHSPSDRPDRSVTSPIPAQPFVDSFNASSSPPNAISQQQSPTNRVAKHHRALASSSPHEQQHQHNDGEADGGGGAYRYLGLESETVEGRASPIDRVKQRNAMLRNQTAAEAVHGYTARNTSAVGIGPASSNAGGFVLRPTMTSLSPNKLGVVGGRGFTFSPTLNHHHSPTAAAILENVRSSGYGTSRYDPMNISPKRFKNYGNLVHDHDSEGGSSVPNPNAYVDPLLRFRARSASSQSNRTVAAVVTEGSSITNEKKDHHNYQYVAPIGAAAREQYLDFTNVNPIAFSSNNTDHPHRRSLSAQNQPTPNRSRHLDFVEGQFDPHIPGSNQGQQGYFESHEQSPNSAAGRMTSTARMLRTMRSEHDDYNSELVRRRKERIAGAAAEIERLKREALAREVASEAQESAQAKAAAAAKVAKRAASKERSRRVQAEEAERARLEAEQLKREAAEAELKRQQEEEEARLRMKKERRVKIVVPAKTGSPDGQAEVPKRKKAPPPVPKIDESDPQAIAPTEPASKVPKAYVPKKNKAKVSTDDGGYLFKF